MPSADERKKREESLKRAESLKKTESLKREASLSYRDFALVYDEMMQKIDYSRWVEYLTALARKYGIVQPGPLLDLACGTGVFIELMAGCGWEVTGVDLSLSMLAVAEERLKKSGIDALLFHQDLRDLELPQKFPLVTCLCDSLNYITSCADLKNVLQKIKRVLTPEGLFILDLNTYYKYANILENNTFAETFADSAYIWINTFDPEKKICRMELDFFLRKQNDLFRHFHEVHLQRAYTTDEFINLAKGAGFSLVEVFGAFSFSPPLAREERVFFVCRG